MERIALLARLRVDPSEMPELAREFAEIVRLVDRIGEFKDTGQELLEEPSLPRAQDLPYASVPAASLLGPQGRGGLRIPGVMQGGEEEP